MANERIKTKHAGTGPRGAAVGPGGLLSLGYPLSMTAKEKLLRDVLDLDEAKAARARIIVADEPEEESEVAPLPEGWGETLTGEPMPNVAAAVRRSRESH